MANDNKILIFDTTLRDGEQSAGIGLTKFEKLESLASTSFDTCFRL